MSDLLNSASLVMIPSGYKEDIVYSEVPTNGNGDLSFTRASNGTRVNSAGLVEVVPWNMAGYSEDFNNAGWNKYQSSVSANTTTAPNGTTTADLLIDNSGNDVHITYQGIAGIVAGIYTMSVYAKASTLSHINLQWYDNSGTFYTSNAFNLSNGTTTGANQSIESVGNGWYRCIFTFTTTVSGTQYAYVMLNNGTSYFYTGTGSGAVYIWGYQLNIGSTAKPYFPTTDRLNVPRLTYQNGGGGCPSLLLEKQSTNLVTYSEQFDNANWSKEDISVTANATTSPDGTTNADKLIPNTSNTDHAIYQSSASSVERTFSVYAKANGYNYIFLGTNNNAATDGVFFDLTNGTISQNTSTLTPSIESVGNGWYRCIVSQASWPSVYVLVCVSQNGTSFNFAGNGTDGISVWGAQHEASSYPTSYIPTTSSSATRVADACFKTGISSLIGQREGVLFADFSTFVGANDDRQISINDGSISNRVTMALLTNGTQIQFVVQSGGSIVMNTTQTIAGLTTRVKIAYAYKLNDFAIYANGSLLATDTSGAVPVSPSVLSFDAGDSTDKFLGKVNQVALFPTRLTNAELASLTTI